MARRLTSGAEISSRSLRWAIAILVLALVVRLAVVIETSGYEPKQDAADYHRHAVSIARGHGYPETQVAPAGGPTALRPPLYPYFLAGIYSIGGEHVDAARVVQAVLGTITVALIGLIALLLWGELAAGIAMVLAAVYPPLLESGAALLSEPLFLPLELGALAAALMHRRRGDGASWAVLAGVLVGLATLTRTNGFVLALPVALAVWSRRPRSSLSALSPPLAMLAAAAVVIAPWTIRNAVVMDSFTPVSTQTGYTLAGTYNDTSRDDPQNPWAWRPADVPGYHDLFRPGSPLDEVEMDRELRSRALNYISDHPQYVVEASFWNTMRMFELTGFDWAERVAGDFGISPRFADLAVVSFWSMALLAIAGALTREGRRTPFFFWITPLLLLLSVVYVEGTTRFRTPSEPFVVCFAALAVQAAYRAVRAGRGEPDSPGPVAAGAEVAPLPSSAQGDRESPPTGEPSASIAGK